MKENNSRTKNSLLNIIVSFISQFATQLMSFVVRTVFIRTLSIEYLGINGLFTNILTVLSLAELGVGSALIYSMYKPMAKNDVNQIKIYMNLYKKIYRIIGVAVLAIGLSLIPFLDFFMAERRSIEHLQLIYMLYVLKTVSTYFFAYKQSIFISDQKNYIINRNITYFTIIRSILEIVILITTHNFIADLTIVVICNYVQNIYIAHKADKMYPFIKENNNGKASREVTTELFKNVRAMFLHKIGSVVLNSSDAIVISKLIGLTAVGLFSNYSMIIVIVRNTINTIFDGIVPSVGNLYANGSKKGMYQIYNSINLLNMWIVGFCSICLYVLINPFITLWIGTGFLLPISAVLAIVISFYIQLNLRAIEMFRSATGLFYNDRYVPIIQCVINLIISISLVKPLGITGVYIGTIVAILTTSFWVQPLLVFKKIFNQPVWEYFLFYIKFTIATILSLYLTKLAIMFYEESGIIGFIYKMFCCFIIPNIVYLFAYYRNTEFIFLFSKFKPVLKKILKR